MNREMKAIEQKLTSLIIVIESTENKVGLNSLKEIKEEVSKLIKILKSDSVYTALRHADKNPSSSGMNECEDTCYQDLYEISKQLKYGE